MRRSFSLGKKIWLSLGILILGYFISMVFGFVSGQQTEIRLYNVSESLFPATKHSQAALTAFSEQIRLYNDAVVLGDPALLESARIKANQVRDALQGIADLTRLDIRMRDRVREALNRFDDFVTSAQDAYSKMSGTSEGEASHGNKKGPNLEKTVANLAQETKGLQKMLTSITLA